MRDTAEAFEHRVARARVAGARLGRATLWLVSILAATTCVGASVRPAASAIAATTPIVTFDDLAANQSVDSQYATQGVQFQHGFIAGDFNVYCLPKVTNVGAGQAHSGTQV